jgi:FkbH-like protein
MSIPVNALEVLESYLQHDSTARINNFKPFLKALEIVSSSDGLIRAAEYASRAVSPYLDYSSLRKLRKYLIKPGSESLRIAVLGGPTTLQLVELLEVFLAGAGISATILQCEYGLFRQEILAPSDKLDQFKPQVVFLATSSRDVVRCPDVTNGNDEVSALLEAEVSDWLRLWTLANERWGATVIQNTFDPPPWDTLGHFAVRHRSASTNWLERLNAAFAERAPSFVVLHDLRQLVLAQGASQWFDPRFYLEAKMPCGPECLVIYAHSVISLLRSIVGKSKKVLVLDLDNTIWGGTVGDLGAEGIQFGQGSSEGEAFLAFQQYAKDLHGRGVLLAVCSKNDEEKALEPFESRSDMVIRLSDIACFVANWRDKAENLRDIANRLSLGIDSLVFVDDNPAERALVRRLLPQVAVPDMPEDPAGYIQALACQRYFETTSFTQEDARRNEYYVQSAKREAMASRVEDLEVFLASLEMRARVEPVGRLNIDRVTQLVNKTNQFNLTTRRYTHSEVQAIATDPAMTTLVISLRDNLGDSGLISVLFLRKDSDKLVIETWLMSCRVLKRGVEHLALDLVAQKATILGCQYILGTYIPSEKNGMVKNLYSELGFEASGEIAGETTWRLPLSIYSSFSTHIELESQS